MRKLLKLSLLFAVSLVSGWALGQNTTVSATITDSDSFVWSNAAYSIQFVPAPAFPNIGQYKIGSGALTDSTCYKNSLGKGVTSSIGFFSVAICDNTQIQPQGSSWAFTIQSNTSAPATAYQPVQVYGSTFDLSNFFSSNSVTPRFPAINGAYGYGDVELTTRPNPGGAYFNTTTLIPRYWNGTVWTNFSGSTGGVTSINGLAGTFTFNGNAVTCTGGSPNICTFTQGGGGGGGSFTLNNYEMGAYSTGAQTLGHAQKYILPIGFTTAQINTLFATDPNATFEFQGADTTAQKFTNTTSWNRNAGNGLFYQVGANIIHDQAFFFHRDRNWDQDGVACDARQVNVTNVSTGSNTISIGGGYVSTQDIGKVLWMYFPGQQTAWEAQMLSTSDGLHITLSSNAPLNYSGFLPVYLGTDNSTTEQAALSLGAQYGNGYGPPAQTTASAGACMAHTLLAPAGNLIGAGILTNLIQAPGEDTFVVPDPAVQNYSPGSSNDIGNFAVTFTSDIDATKPWTRCNDSGCAAQTANYHPAYRTSVLANNPKGTAWCISNGPYQNGSGCANGVATTNGTTTMCVPPNAGTPNIGGQIEFPYQTTLLETTVVSQSGTCSGGSAGFTPYLLGASVPAGTQQEWFSGTNLQHSAIDMPAGRGYPFTLTEANSLTPNGSGESSVVGPYGMIKIGAEQCTYSHATKVPSLGNSLTITGCTGTSVDHPSGSFNMALNPFTPSQPWPVIPTINSGDTTPSNAEYYPGHNIGNCFYDGPQMSGATGFNAGWNHANIHDIYIQGVGSSYNTCGFFATGTFYATHFRHITIFGTQYGIIQSGPANQNHNFYNGQPTADGMSWQDVTLSVGYPYDFIAGNQITLENFDTYSSYQGNGWAGAFFYTNEFDDQTGAVKAGVSHANVINHYVEPEGGSYAGNEPLMQIDCNVCQFIGLHQGGGGEDYIGGHNNTFLGGNFNNSFTSSIPVINYGAYNNYLGITNAGAYPLGNTYGTNSFINFGPGTQMAVNTTGEDSGPIGTLAYGNNRSAWSGQSDETFTTGNITAPYVTAMQGLITPEEYAPLNFDAQTMNHNLWTFDATATVTQSNAGCTVGTNPSNGYCTPHAFNLGAGIQIGPGQRIVNGKYIVYASFKDGTAATNTFHFSIASLANGLTGCSTNLVVTNFTVPITNQWPASNAATNLGIVDLSSPTYTGCYLQLNYNGATTADVIYNQFVNFVPLPELTETAAVSIQGVGAPTINLGSAGQETWQTAAPTTGCGTTYPNGTIWHNSAGTAAGVNRYYICDAATTTWNAKF
jgi:hypothetical protein